MSLTVIGSIPVESILVPSFLENIIDRKIAKLALNMLEKLVDRILSWIYCPYNQLYQEKKARIYTFGDGLTCLIDSTKLGIAKIDFDWETAYVALHSIKVLFNPDPNIEFTFSRDGNTDYVVILNDDKRGRGWYKIIEQEIASPTNPRPMEKHWHVNTHDVHKLGRGNSPKAWDFLLVEQPRATPRNQIYTR